MTECVKYDESFLKIDIGIRNLQFAKLAKAAVPLLSPEARRCVVDVFGYALVAFSFFTFYTCSVYLGDFVIFHSHCYGLRCAPGFQAMFF